MADDPWASWHPRDNPAAVAQQAFRARQALSRGGSVDPAPAAASSTAAAAAAAVAIAARITSEGRNGVSNSKSFPAGGSGRAPLPDPPSFPNRGPGGRRDRDRSPFRQHADRGWGRKNNDTSKPGESRHVVPITTPLITQESSTFTAGGKGGNRERGRSEDRRPRPDDRDQARRRSRSRSLERNRPKESSERFRTAIPDERSKRRRDRSDSPQQERHARRDAGTRTSRREDYGDRRRDGPHTPSLRQRDASPERRTSDISRYPGETRGTTLSTTLLTQTSNVRQVEGRTILLEGLLEGTTTSDVKTILEGYGEVERVTTQRVGTKAGKVNFEATFIDHRYAATAIRALDGILADGCRIRATHVDRRPSAQSAQVSRPSTSALPSVKAKSPPAPRAKTPKELSPPAQVDLKLKGFANSGDKENSLLSRLGDLPLKKPVNDHHEKANGSKVEGPPSELLSPYEGLLYRAGVDSVSKLKQLVRPGTVREYVEMLCAEYPNEELLRGLTAKWALRERLEEWLNVKESSAMHWQREEASARGVDPVESNGHGPDEHEEDIALE